MTLNKIRTIDVFGVPTDLGANMRGTNMGPAAVRIAGLKRKILDLDYTVVDQGDIKVPVREEISPDDTKQNYLETIRDVCRDLSDKVFESHQRGNLPLVLGGDHSLAIGSIAGSSRYHQSNNNKLGVIWVDAHADLNNPISSPSGNIHGMPLAILLGDGDKRLTEVATAGNKVLKPEQVTIIGLRNIDGKEKELLKNSGVNYYTMRSIDEKGMYTIMTEILSEMTKKMSAIHLSFDIDGIDPLFAPGVSTPVSGGISYREAHLALEMIADTKLLRSAEFVELNPIQDQAHKTAELTVELIQSALGKSIV